MAVITATEVNVTEVRVVNTTTMTAADTLTYVREKNPLLVLRNGTAGALTVNIKGNTATSVPVSGVGPVSLSAGYSTGSIAAGSTIAIALKTIEKWLEGSVVNLTGGTGISAQLIHAV
jgi:hypothetical protein